MENTLVRIDRCAECGSEMLWSQNVWPVDLNTEAAYRCVRGHVLDPSKTRQCPKCGIHDTRIVSEGDGTQHFTCSRCAASFSFPR